MITVKKHTRTGKHTVDIACVAHHRLQSAASALHTVGQIISLCSTEACVCVYMCVHVMPTDVRRVVEIAVQSCINATKRMLGGVRLSHAKIADILVKVVGAVNYLEQYQAGKPRHHAVTARPVSRTVFRSATQLQGCSVFYSA